MTYREVPGGWVFGDAPAKAGFGGNIETANQMRLTFESECRRLETQLSDMIGMRNDLRSAHDNLHQRVIDTERLYTDLLQRLGVNGHEGAIAEISLLRASAGLRA